MFPAGDISRRTSDQTKRGAAVVYGPESPHANHFILQYNA